MESSCQETGVPWILSCHVVSKASSCARTRVIGASWQGPTAEALHCAEAIEQDLPLRREKSRSDVEEVLYSYIETVCVFFSARSDIPSVKARESADR
jgi:hypothetical protein